MSKTFVVSDLHGRFDLFEAALARISTYCPQGTIVFTGDYVDRGPDSRRIIQALKAGPSEGWRWIALKGNHEEMMVRAEHDSRERERWLANGGLATLASYDGAVPTEDLAWAAKLPIYFKDEHRIYVHAGVDPAMPVEEQDAATLLWLRYQPGSDIDYPGFHIVHGHTPNPDGPELYRGRSNLDTLAVRTGRLVVGVFDDDRPGGPSDLIEILSR
ncbi:MAG: serine/threonine protein phosphatase [Devosia nanyangense]|nr:serine/threonine protein phosphatase [Devosia nanyangense]